MRIRVKVKTGKGSPEISGDLVIIYTTARMENNQANRDVMKQLSKIYGCTIDRIRLMEGRTSRNKVFDLIE